MQPTDILRQKIDPVRLAQLNGQGDAKRSGQSAVFCFLRFLYGVPKYRAVLPSCRSTVREKDVLPYEFLLAGIVWRSPQRAQSASQSARLMRSSSTTACPVGRW